MRSLQSSLPCVWASKSRLRVCVVWRHRGDRIEGIDLADGTRIDADLYIDASGGDAALLSRLASAKFESWSEWLPCDRMLAASGPRLPQLPAFSQISAFRGGWVGQFPLQDRTAIAAVYNSAAISDSEVVELAGVIARSPITGEGIVSELRPGMQVSPWIGNCVAIGEAAISVDPIDAVELHVTHGCISHLMTTFPATAGRIPGGRCVQRGGPRLRRQPARLPGRALSAQPAL